MGHRAARLQFIIPARHGDRIYKEARQQALGEQSGLVTHRAQRGNTVRKRKPEGGPLRVEQQLTEVVGVEGCTSFETYAPAEQVLDGEHRAHNKKSFQPNALNAVVVTRQDGRAASDMVLLTNGQVHRPFAAFDDYDERSRIENRAAAASAPGHRTLKQDWCLEAPPQRTAKAAGSTRAS